MSRAKIFMAAIVGVLALSGFVSALASAVPPGWMVNGANFTSGTKALASTAAVDSPGVFTGAGIEIKCGKAGSSVADGINARINGATNMGDAESLVFLECASPQCTVTKTIGTLPLLVDLTLDGELAVKGVFLAPNTEHIFTTIKFTAGTGECALAGETLPVKGEEEFLAPTGQMEETWQQINAIKASRLKLGANPATLEGSILVKLASGEPFSFL